MRITTLILAATVFTVLIALGTAASAQEELKYQKRANRYEGIKPKPVSGYDIELLSARIDYTEEGGRIGERLAVKFYLPKRADVHLVVRELDYKHYYWLDRIEPKTPWHAGFGNVFEWPTKDVVGQLNNFGLSELGVVARLDKPQPSSIEKVAPAILYQSGYPSRAKSYLFTFKLRDDAKVTSMIYREEASDPIDKQAFPRVTGGRPFTVKWDASGSNAPEGAYRLVLKGYFLDTNDPIAQTVGFYHQPNISER